MVETLTLAPSPLLFIHVATQRIFIFAFLFAYLQIISQICNKTNL